MRRCLLLVTLLVYCLTGEQSHAQDRGALIVSPTDSDSQVTLYARSSALVIGIDKYSGGWPRLSNAVNDAKAIAAELEQRGFSVQLVTDPNSAQLRQAIEQFVFERGSDPEARLFIWFAGHGHTVDGEGYLVPAGAPGPQEGWRFRKEALSLRSFGRYMREVRSKHVLAVFDSCFAGTVFTSARSLPSPAITRATTQPVRQFVSSGEAEQVVSDDGTFRKLFVDALNGLEPNADANRDGYITGSELGLFLSDRITTLSDGAQTPRYGKLNALKLDRGDFVFSIGRDLGQVKFPAGAQPASPALPGLTPDAAAWRIVQDSDSEAVLQAFIDEFPDSVFAKFASARLAEMNRVARLPDQAETEVEGPGQSTICDQLAAHPGDATAPPGTGVGFDVLERDAEAAVKACRQAVAAEPDNLRLTYQLARALHAADNHSEAFRLYKAASASGHIAAFYSLGLAYELGIGVPSDVDEAIRWYRKAADAGNAHAMNEIGSLYVQARGVQRDYQEALRWFHKAAEKGLAVALGNLGFMYEHGNGVSRDTRKAARLYRQAAEKGDVNALASLGNFYARGHGVPRDSAEAIRLFRAAIEKGSPRAMVSLGFMYEQGNGVPRDPAEAVRWYRKAAGKGDASAVTSLGVMYEQGLGVSRDSEEAVRLYRKAIEMGDARAMGNLGNMYARGEGVSRDLPEAIRWFRKAVENGDPNAMNNLGMAYAQGLGVNRDLAESLRWFRKAADNGHANAMTNVGVAYEFGRGVQIDYGEAVRWYRKAVENGDAHGMGNLGGLYNSGRGVERDVARSARLIADALKLGYEFSLKQMTTNSSAWGQGFRLELQRILKAEGFYDGPIDGSFGPATKNAIRKLAGKS